MKVDSHNSQPRDDQLKDTAPETVADDITRRTVCEHHTVLLKRLAHIAARTQQSKKRHHDAASVYRRRHRHASILLIAFSAVTVGILSLLSNEEAQTILGPQVLACIGLASITSAAVTMLLSVYLMTFRFETSSFMHDQSAHRYTSLRDTTIHLAYQIRYFGSPTDEVDQEVLKIEQECNRINSGAPPIPKAVHRKAFSEEKRSADPRYWFKGFVYSAEFMETWSNELEHQPTDV